MTGGLGAFAQKACLEQANACAKVLDSTTMTTPGPEDEKGRILPFQRRGSLKRPVPPSPVEDVGKYAVSEEPDNYRQRMINNGLALAFCILLVAIGVWLATSIAEMRRNQDCVLSGRRNCANVIVPPANPIGSPSAQR
jgi:hypothetical protein